MHHTACVVKEMRLYRLLYELGDESLHANEQQETIPTHASE